jgi:hypothetical protein
MHYSDMSGSSTSSSPRMVEVTSSRRPEPAAREENVSSSSRSVARPAREDQQAARPHAVPGGSSALEARRDPPRRVHWSEERVTPPHHPFDGSDRPDSDSL